jgi:plastocyanin
MRKANMGLVLCLCVAGIATACGSTSERTLDPAIDRRAADEGQARMSPAQVQASTDTAIRVALPAAAAAAETPDPAASQPALGDPATMAAPDGTEAAQPRRGEPAEAAVATAAPEPNPQPPVAAAAPRPTPAARPTPVAASSAQQEAPAATARISGRVELVAGAGQSVAAGEVGQAVVYFIPDGAYPRPKARSASISTRAGAFTPSVTVVPVGSTVRFPNEDTILHNVFSRSPGNSFDLGLYGAGEVRQHRFATPGLVVVNCNVHHNMRANLIVLATPYHARPGRDGRYRIEGIPPGPGTLVFWHPRSGAQSVKLEATGSSEQFRRLTATRPPLNTGNRTGR